MQSIASASSLPYAWNPLIYAAPASVRTTHRKMAHGLAYDVADGEDVGHVGAHLDVDVDEATACHGYTGSACGEEPDHFRETKTDLRSEPEKCG